MPDVRITLHRFDALQDAMEAVDAIRAAGEISYTGARGNKISVTVGDVTVDNSDSDPAPDEATPQG
jgi:hypothetical protein